MCFASSRIRPMTLSVSVLVSLVCGFGTCLLSWPLRNRRRIHTPVVPPRRLQPLVIQSLQLQLPVARYLVSRPSQVAHPVVPLLFFVPSLVIPPWAPYPIVTVLMDVLRSTSCSMRRMKMNSNNQRDNTRRGPALPPLLCGRTQIRGSASAAARARA